MAILIVLASATGFGLLLVAAVGPLQKSSGPWTCVVWCLFRDRADTAEFREDARDGTRIALKQRSALSPPTAITPETRCLHLARMRAVA